MQFSHILTALAAVAGVHAGLFSSRDGRICNAGQRNYVSWSDTTSAVSKWCSAHAGQTVPQRGKIDDGAIGGYRSGDKLVNMYVKYQNDHAPGWVIGEESCNWYLLYITQGCTPAGNKPSDAGKLYTGGGIFYEPKMGYIEMVMLKALQEVGGSLEVAENPEIETDMEEKMEATAILPDRTKGPKHKKEKGPKAPKTPKGPTPPATKRPPAAKPPAEDPDSMFKVGFLADVYQERPVGPEGIKKVVTRFPPEPNGFLHIGHSKAIAINFGFARYHGGDCYLRFDDTNPKGEEEKFFVAIEEMVRWLGFKPVQITYSSDNFDRLYELAEKLISIDGAYVCHCTKSEIMAQRGGGEGEGKARYACPHRDRPTGESLTEFRAMRDGKYSSGEAALRMKQDIENDNPQMWDVFAYRILEDKHAKHHRTGDKWRIYPTYDFTHCLCDSFEGITHSLCTTEFELSRVSYEWLCDKLKVYKPMQREYGRLNISGTVLSKRKIIELVNGKYVSGWDDPRLYTLIALRRRGVPPGAILSFVNELGVTKATTNIEIKRFEQSVRRYLETTVPRLMLVLEPIPVIIDNLPDDYAEMIEMPFSKDPAYGSHTVPFTKTVYIESSDFREVDSDSYFRLAPGKTVGLLKVPFPITATTFEKDPATGRVTAVHATYEKPEDGVSFKKPKSYIHWVAKSPAHHSPIKTEVRVFNPLFKSSNPQAHPDGYLADINPASIEKYPNAMIETGFEEIKRRAPWPEKEGEKDDQTAGIFRPETVRFQGMRAAYFCLDSESTEEEVILNRIVSLKEDAEKN